MNARSKKAPRGTPAGKKSAAGPRTRLTAITAKTRQVTVKHLDSPPRIKRPKRIHARHLLPFVAEGKERGRHSLDARARSFSPDPKMLPPTFRLC
jgi:hypothetical protein